MSANRGRERRRGRGSRRVAVRDFMRSLWLVALLVVAASVAAPATQAAYTPHPRFATSKPITPPEEPAAGTMLGVNGRFVRSVYLPRANEANAMNAAPSFAKPLSALA